MPLIDKRKTHSLVTARALSTIRCITILPNQNKEEKKQNFLTQTKKNSNSSIYPQYPQGFQENDK